MSKHIANQLLEILPNASVHFDLEDCDKILRVETAQNIDIQQVIILVKRMGFHCEVLND